MSRIIKTSAFPIVEQLILVLIMLNIVALVLESVAGIRESAGRFFTVFETLSVVVFTVEYIVRITRLQGNRFKYALTPLMLIDLIAVIPFYLPFIYADLRFLRVFRMFRFARVAKFARYSNALQTLGRVVSSKKEELLTTFMFLLILLLLASCLMYYAENDAQPDAFASIPHAMWWAVATLSTVGYGDVCPTTVIGKLLAGTIAVLGIGMFALPTGIIGAALTQEWDKDLRCPHCDKPLK